MSDPRLVATLGFISAISRSLLAIASLGLLEDEDELPADTGGRYHGPPNPPPAQPPRFSQAMAACMLLVGAQGCGLGYAATADTTTG